MKKQKVIASPMITRFMFWDIDLFTKTILEYVEYLRRKVKRDEDGVYLCVTETDDHDKCWGKTENFCKKKGLDSHVFWELLTEYYGEVIICESYIANDFDSAAFLKKMSQFRQRS